ncbi:hypothetical protein PCAR4_350217 [Paraburkholderia caribensis]|nr:hypothetical protein PCAR4_350217 [Paraburkholderia caribensis]
MRAKRLTVETIYAYSQSLLRFILTGILIFFTHVLTRQPRHVGCFEQIAPSHKKPRG